MSDQNENKLDGITIIIPVYNEKDSVKATIESLHLVLANQNLAYEIIAVNDGSSDGSDKILNSLPEQQVVTIHHDKNLGYGAALKTGIKSARHPWIIITDADGTYPVDRVPDLIFHAKNNDMVVGARLGKKVHDTIFRKIGRGIVRGFASYVTGQKISDINSGLRIFKKADALRFWNLFPDGFSFTTTITVASHTSGNRVKYLPIDYHKRSGNSSIRPTRDFVGFMSLIARLAVYYRPLKVFTPLALFLFFLSWGVLFYSYFFLHQILDATWAVLFISSIQIQIFALIADMIVKRFYSD